MIGGGNPGQSNQVEVAGGAWFDDVDVEAYPATFNYESLTTHSPFPDVMALRETGGEFTNIVPQTVSAINGSATNGSLGAWETDEGGISAQDLRGYLEYTVNAPSDDAYRIEVEGRERYFRTPAVDLPLNISIDGEFLGQYNLPYSPTSNGRAHCFTPFIRAGNHTIGIFWDNGRSRRFLHVDAVCLQSLPSSDVYANGMKAWVANRLAAQCGVEVAPASSLVSPVCVEGRGPYLSMMAMNAGPAYPLSPVTIHAGTGYRWYANVTLSSSNMTRIETSFQNGAFTQTNEIEWQVTDLLTASDLTIRKGDALLFNALPEGETNGTVVIQISGAGSQTTDGTEPVPFQFSQAGAFTVTGTFVNSGASGTIQVTVVDGSLPAVVAVPLLGWRSPLVFTNLPAGVIIDSDPRLGIGPAHPSPTNETLQALGPNLDANSRLFRVWNASVETEHILARLGTGGPVLASAAVKGVLLHIPPETPLRHLTINSDGSELIEGTYFSARFCHK
jgi:hypothetical protein